MNIVTIACIPNTWKLRKHFEGGHIQLYCFALYFYYQAYWWIILKQWIIYNVILIVQIYPDGLWLSL